MKCTNILRMAALPSLALLLSFPSAGAVPRKNVLWIYLEDVSDWFSCYGETMIKTPHIDGLAAGGIRLDRFYTPAGVCSATRSAIVTGMMQTSIGAHHHRSGRANFRGQDLGPGFDDIRLPQGVKTLPDIFRAAGYWTFNEGGKDDYNFKHDTGEMYDFIPKGKGGLVPASLVAGNCWKGRKKGQPFFGQVQLKGGKLGRNAKKVTDRSKVNVPPYYPDTTLVREEIAHHYDCLLKTDEQVGEVVAALKRDGLYKDTVIFLFSDHGYKLHRHKQYLYEGGIHMPGTVSGPGIPAGKVRKDLVSGIDISAASLAVAGIPIPEKMEGRNFLAKDYQPREYLIAARDRCDYTYERIRAVVTPRFKYLRNYLTDRPFMNPSYKDPWPVSQEMRRLMAEGKMNKTQLIFFGDKKPDEELYDLANDPHEINNLANKPEFKAELERHRKILSGWIASSGDQGQETESDAGLLAAMKRWGEKCVNPEYDRVRDAYRKWKANRPAQQPKPAPRKKGGGGGKKKKAA
jgi:N-sulfoglucosamine sulfohydrolase